MRRLIPIVQGILLLSMNLAFAEPCDSAASAGPAASAIQRFDNAVAPLLDSITWYCEPKSRSIYLTQRGMPLRPELLAGRYGSVEACHEEADKLDALVPRIASREGVATVHALLVCYRNEFYLVKQDASLDRIPQEGVHLERRYFRGNDDCVDLPRKFMSAVGFGGSLKLLTNSKRVDDANRMIQEHQKSFLEKHFRTK